VNVTIRPLPDQLPEGIETVILRLDARFEYEIAGRGRAFALISDNGWLHASDRIRSLTGCLHLCFPAENDRQYRVEASSDLVNWETAFIGIATDGTVHFVEDEMETFRNRFYRLTLEPGPVPNN
jgi:hypothetical protein